MGDFKYLSEEEFNSLSAKERRDYLKQKRDYENAKLVEDTLNTSEIKEVAKKVVEKPAEEMETIEKSQFPTGMEKKEPSEVATPTQSEGILDYERIASFMPATKKVTKTKHKNFLMTEKRYNQFKELAKMRGQSENALFNDILTQIFGEE